ncbi:Ig-like domain-containing protein [Kocuria sp. LHG3120]|uniref:Ig-like domain-containing protein n=1 Tax=Kocuria sp. LHG3120 TaxID=2804590 RepID=UPI003CF51323
MTPKLREQLLALAESRARANPADPAGPLEEGTRAFQRRTLVLYAEVLLTTVLLSFVLLLVHPALRAKGDLPGDTSSAVVLAPATPELAVGETHRFAAHLVYADGSAQEQPIVTGLTWSSSMPAIARVDGTGLVTAFGPGRSTISATVGEASGSAVVVITESPQEPAPVALSLDPPTPELDPLQSHQFAARLVLDDGTVSEPLVSGIDWRADDPTVAEVDGTGLVTARAPGRTTITATARGMIGSSKVIVPDAQRTSVLLTITLQPPDWSVPGPGLTQQFTAVGRYSDGTVADPLTTGVRWTSDNPTFAAVDETGLVNITDDLVVEDGTAIIIATVGDVSGTAPVTAQVVE